MKSSEQLEREAEDRREHISETLDELRARMTPGQIVDQIIDYARNSGGADFVRNLGQQIVDRPLPIVLVGTGLAWLMLSNGRPPRARGDGLDTGELRDSAGRLASGARDVADRVASGAREAADSASATASGLVGRAKSVVSGMRSAVSDATGTVRDTASRSRDSAGSLIERVRARASSTYEGASDATRRAAGAVAGSTASLGRSVGSGSQQFMEFAREQPMVLAGLGMAVGAAIGAAIPASEAENRFMGEASDDMKDRMRRVAGKVKDTARGAYEDIKDAAAGETQDSASAAEQPVRSDGGSDASHGGAGEVARSDGGDAQLERSAARGPSAPIDGPTAMRGGDECAEPPADPSREPR